jgi:uncharacterized protein (DUF433 family)
MTAEAAQWHAPTASPVLRGMLILPQPQMRARGFLGKFVGWSGSSRSPALASLCLRRYSEFMNERIVVDPAICNGRPVIKNTRITVQTILEFLGAGDSIDDVLEEYPSLSREDVLAALQYSSRLLGNHFRLEQVV